jgi:hypothetical protein
MLTQLPSKLETVQDVERFISSLYKNHEFFHLDDDAADIVDTKTNQPIFTPDEAKKINELLEQAFEICDVWSLAIVETIINQIPSSFIYNGFAVDIHPNGFYWCAIATHTTGKTFGSFDKTETKVIEKIMTKIENYKV